jgi:IS30 family transposase
LLTTKAHIPNRLSIDERPETDYGQTIGDWEMDTIVGKEGKGAIVTLVERKSSFMLMEKLDTGKQAVPLANTVVRLYGKRAACKVDNDRQRAGVCRTRNHCEGT